MKLISGLFHPLILATYFLGILYYIQPGFFSPVAEIQIPKLILAAFVTTFVIPVLSILIMKYTSRISSLSLSSREERSLPFISILMFYAATTYLFIFRLGMKPPLSTMMVAMTLLIGMLLVITYRQKISIHAAANWALSGLISGIFITYPVEKMLYPLIGSLMIAGLVSSSRLYLGRHTEQEVWSGAGLGYLVGFTSVVLFN